MVLFGKVSGLSSWSETDDVWLIAFIAMPVMAATGVFAGTAFAMKMGPHRSRDPRVSARVLIVVAVLGIVT